MKPSFPLLTIVLLATLAFPTNGHAEGRKERSGRPVLYNFIARAGEPIDQTIREQYSAKYDVVEIRDRSSFSSPRLTKERFPNPVFDANNVEISGSVRVCVVITADGRVVDPAGSGGPQTISRDCCAGKRFPRGCRGRLQIHLRPRPKTSDRRLVKTAA
jgi:hypothetical protein